MIGYFLVLTFGNPRIIRDLPPSTRRIIVLKSHLFFPLPPCAQRSAADAPPWMEEPTMSHARAEQSK